MTVDELRAALNKAAESRGGIARVATLSGVSRMTINRVRKGETTPNMGTFERLKDAIVGRASPAKVRKPK